ncbi:MAG: tyrosine--tRNA ligase [Gemmatimonadetes bacterium]|jgi:tyrosyl-tRNA synthetase|nr:tyrosine--tRNA ligase [Gemmatimonadota bacterium]MBT4610883.1 tyrosine--tRNA ligase [Gemmatimonadota bacterium]MBT5059014.1 tyrosine--tRNA ligase [Gemmatimonadota bacterium]MBT5145315.1 tyrosine--tRNA ligase [Gemmatimonadota bacterium]MBT5587513.1 tyrosine--tRNA ligase [Gemmatimonadota bacterium]
MNLLEDLAFRGQLYQVTDQDALNERLNTGPISLYCGFDPTADSLTIGNLVQIMLLRRFQLAGHRPIALVGGGTGLIGDPSGKAQERTLNTADIVEQWSARIRGQIEPFLDFDGPAAARMANNYDWLGSLGAIELMRDVGKHFPVPFMLAKESVSSRLASGISYTEFSYMILQSYDFLELYRRQQCQLQVGGSDQWGNITAGTELIRRADSGRAFGLTCPLVTNADGTKFGKTEKGTIWLSAKRTSPYEFYQFWMGSDDRSVVSYLKTFTFLSHGEILDLEKSVAENPGQREAQRTLAALVTELVHGKDAAQKAERISRALFYGELTQLLEDEIEEAFHDVPTHAMEGAESPLINLLMDASVASSKRQARQDITSGAIYLNGERCTDLDHTVRKADGLHGRYIVIRRGKNKYTLVQ